MAKKTARKPAAKPINLRRTRAALAVFDTAADAWEATPTHITEDVMESARQALADAFAADVADRNDAAEIRTFVLSLSGMTFVRRLCAGVK